MNLKRIAMVGAAAAIMLTSAVPTFAFFPIPSNDIGIKNFAVVTNRVEIKKITEITFRMKMEIH